MTTPFLHKPMEWRGYWWLPEKFEQKLPGTLTYDPHDGIELTLIGSFGGSVMEEPGKRYPVIHGACNSGITITLVDAISDGLCVTVPHFDLDLSKQTVSAQWIMVGGGFPIDANEITIKSLQCSIENTLAWSLTGYIPYGTNSNENGISGSMNIPAPTDQVVEVDDVRYSLKNHVSRPYQKNTRSKNSVTIDVEPVFHLVFKEPRSVSSAFEEVTKLADLIALATGGAPMPLWVTVETGRKIEGRDWWMGLYPHVKRNVSSPDSKSVDTRDMIFTTLDVPFVDVVPRWFKVREHFWAPYIALVASRYMSAPYIEASVLTATAAAEACHKGLGETHPKPGNSFRLDERLMRLAERVPSSPKVALLEDPKTWAEITSCVRNFLSHEGRTNYDIATMHAVDRVTRAVVLVNILLQLGLKDEKILKTIQYHSDFIKARSYARRYFSAESDTEQPQ